MTFQGEEGLDAGGVQKVTLLFCIREFCILINSLYNTQLLMHVTYNAAVTGVLLTAVERNTQPGLWHVCRG